MKVGDLVRPKPGTCEGDEKALGLGIIVDGPHEDIYSTRGYCQVEWIKSRGRKWTFYLDDLILVSEGKNENR